MQMIWNVLEQDKKKVDNYMKKFKISESLARMLIAKNILPNDVKLFLDPEIELLCDPFLLPDMEKFVARVLEAKEKNEKIVIYGDYDVDGVTSITVLYSFFKDIGIDATYYLPGRIEEGYGLNCNALKKIKEEGANLVITVDCGISAIIESKYANEISLDLLITDHHECGEVLPEALAIVNPKRVDSKYPFSLLAGVGVTFKCISAIAQKLNLSKESYLKYLDLVTVGTIADIVPLLGENRIIAYNGIKALKDTKNLGLKALIKVANLEKITSDTISFGLAPRINACGRMNDASLAVELLLAKTEEEALRLAQMLDSYNIERQTIEKQIFKEAVDEIEKEKLNEKRTIVLAHEGWHQGVIGIVASKLTEMYLKPVILLAIDDNNIAKGSARIPQGVSLYEAISMCQELLLGFGGHELAAGLSMEEKNIPAFKEKFEEVICMLKPEPFDKVINIDVKLENQKADFNLIRDIAKLAPFGQKNSMPLFLCKGLKVAGVRTIKDNKHLILKLKSGNAAPLDAMFFGAGQRRNELVVGDKIDIVCSLNVNVFMGNITLQYLLVDFKKSM